MIPKIIILVSGALIFGYMVSKSASAIYCFMLIILIGIALFAFSPDMKKILLSSKGIEIEHYKEVQRALVEYDEFKKTVYPILEIILASSASNPYLGVTAKSIDMIDFIHRLGNLPNDLMKSGRMKKLIKAFEVETINSFQGELASLKQIEGLPADTESIVIKHKLFGDKDYYGDNSVSINFVKLKNNIDDFTNPKRKEEYKEKVSSLERFYKEYFTDA